MYLYGLTDFDRIYKIDIRYDSPTQLATLIRPQIDLPYLGGRSFEYDGEGFLVATHGFGTNLATLLRVGFYLNDDYVISPNGLQHWSYGMARRSDGAIYLSFGLSPNVNSIADHVGQIDPNTGTIITSTVVQLTGAFQSYAFSALTFDEADNLLVSAGNIGFYGRSLFYLNLQTGKLEPECGPGRPCWFNSNNIDALATDPNTGVTYAALNSGGISYLYTVATNTNPPVINLNYVGKILKGTITSLTFAPPPPKFPLSYHVPIQQF